MRYYQKHYRSVYGSQRLCTLTGIWRRRVLADGALKDIKRMASCGRCRKLLDKDLAA